MASLKRLFAGLSGTTFLLAFASLFGDISSEMLYPVLPVFLTETLKADAAIVGLVGGVAEAAQQVVQGFSGWLSDKLRRRKPVALFGYVVSAVTKPLMGLAPAWPGVLAARVVERLGSGTRSAPRDALLAASADEAHRGKAFGLEGIGDNLGACLGPLLAIALLEVFSNNLSWIFYLAVVPGLLAALMVVFVRERPVAAPAKAKLDLNVGRFPRGYWKYLFVTALFGVGNSSNPLLILRTKSLGVSLTNTILIYAGFNLVAAVASYPAGHLSDLVGRKAMLFAAFVVFLVVYAGFGITTNAAILGVLFVFYGLFQGIFRAVGKALATDFVPNDLRAGAVGWYTTTVGVSGLVASVLAGALWTHIDPAAAFLFGAAFALQGTVALAVLVPTGKVKAAPF
jgi:MFS family permease